MKRDIRFYSEHFALTGQPLWSSALRLALCDEPFSAPQLTARSNSALLISDAANSSKRNTLNRCLHKSGLWLWLFVTTLATSLETVSLGVFFLKKNPGVVMGYNNLPTDSGLRPVTRDL